MLTKKKQDRMIRFRTGKLLLLGMFFGGGIFVSGMSAQAEMTAEEAAGWLAGYGFTDVNIHNQNSESVPETTENRAEISVEQTEAAFKNVLGSEFAEYTFAMEDEDIIRYIRMDLNWQIEVKRRTGQVQVLNYRGVIMQEFQIE